MAEEDRRISLAGKVLVDKLDAQLLEVHKQGQVVGSALPSPWLADFTAATNARPPPTCSTAKTSRGSAVNGRVASGRFVRAGVVITGWASDRQGELVEGDCQPPLHRFLDGQLMVPAANVLDEGVSGDHDPGAVLLPEPAHRS